ncbi:hypothetical protein ACWC5I_08485 [Kitasatospora sp. NPDC001574]
MAGTSYDVSGAYAFVYITGTGVGKVRLWAYGAADWSGPRATFGGNSHEVC